jgi:hypothetical protein
MKGKPGSKAKDIEGGLMMIGDLQDNRLKQFIQEAGWECCKSNINGTQGVQTQSRAMSNNKVLQGQGQGHGGMTNGGLSPEVVMMNSFKAHSTYPSIDRSTMCAW